MPAVTAHSEDSVPGGGQVVVIVGTDHHPFDRLINWTNEWLRQHPETASRFFVQWGSASVRPACPGARFLEVGELADLLDQADVIVCHGGPSTIAEARARGRMPIVVPRLASLGEHVDDHQTDFCERFAALGRIALARTLPDFTRLLAEAAAEPARFSVTNSGSGSEVDQAVAHLGGLVEELVSRPRQLSLIGKGRWSRHRRRTGGSPIPSPDSDPVASTSWQEEPHDSADWASPQLLMGLNGEEV
jgi:UDP-N-acetylglucosamine transferase subunit ALG13